MTKLLRRTLFLMTKVATISNNDNNLDSAFDFNRLNPRQEIGFNIYAK